MKTGKGTGKNLSKEITEGLATRLDKLTRVSYVYPILEFENYDGDSLSLTIDLGFHQRAYKKVRLYLVDTPELRDKRPEWKAAARLAKTYVEDWLTSGAERGKLLFISENYNGKFGRCLGDVFSEYHDTLLGASLIAHDLAVAYAGQNKKKIEAAHAKNIAALRSSGRI